MKLRFDFVSNSSSCSFFIYIRNKADMDEFNKFKEKTERIYNVSWTAYMSYDMLHEATENCFSDIWMYCYVGEDDLNTIYDLQDIENDLYLNEYKFCIFANKYAHYTIGEPINEKNIKICKETNSN